MMMSNTNASCFSSLGSLNHMKIPVQLRAKNRNNVKLLAVSARLDGDSQSSPANPQVNLSVLRFTLGIPGLDESYLPRWMGYGFGSLLLLNHFLDSELATSAQFRTEVLGLSLAAFSVSLPYLGKFLKGSTPMDQTIIPEGMEQIFSMSPKVTNSQKEDLAWATYILLRNTNSIAVVMSIQGELCIRGYWSIPSDVSKSNVLDWLREQIEKTGLFDAKEALYFPQISDSGLWEILPKGTRSLLVQPVLQSEKLSNNNLEKNDGFLLLASSMRYAYSDKDKAWIRALAKKFRRSKTADF